MSAKKIDFKKIALIGGGLWIGNKLLTKDPATVQAFSAASLGGGNTLDVQALENLIKTNPQIRALLKGDTGAEGTPGGPQGAKGLDGANAPSLSLVQNLGLETGLVQDWETGTISIDGTYNGLPIATLLTSGSNTNLIYIDKDHLYRLSASIKTDGTNSTICVNNYDTSLNLTSKATTGSLSYNVLPNSPASFVKFSYFVGGIGDLATNFADDAVLGGVQLLKNNATSLEFANLKLEKVTIGEPVPYTLPWLPSGQMVYDPATGDVGRWDGTAVTWFATAP